HALAHISKAPSRRDRRRIMRQSDLDFSMSGQTDLAKLIASLQPELQEGVFVFVSQGQDCPVLPDDLAPILRFQEQEGWTFIVEETALRAGFDSTFRCRLITLKVHS